MHRTITTKQPIIAGMESLIHTQRPQAPIHRITARPIPRPPITAISRTFQVTQHGNIKEINRMSRHNLMFGMDIITAKIIAMCHQRIPIPISMRDKRAIIRIYRMYQITASQPLIIQSMADQEIICRIPHIPRMFIINPARITMDIINGIVNKAIYRKYRRYQPMFIILNEPKAMHRTHPI